MEKVNLKDGTAMHKVASELQKRFCLELGGASSETKAPAKKPPKETEPKSDLPVIVSGMPYPY